MGFLWKPRRPDRGGPEDSRCDHSRGRKSGCKIPSKLEEWDTAYRDWINPPAGYHPEHRCARVLEKVVTGLFRNTGRTVLKYLNVEENSAIESLIMDLGFRNLINQFEMAYVVNQKYRRIGTL